MSDQPIRQVWRFGTMSARDPHEPHRVATTLELFFDLVFVVAVGQAAASLHHAIVGHHVLEGVAGYAAVFFAVWWAWVNWTWFASAFDNDDPIYRISTFTQMFGALVLAAGVSEAFEGRFGIVVIGYAIMRFAMVGQWLRAALSNPGVRPAALRYAAGITALQILWIARLAITGAWAWTAFVVLVVAELTLPWWVERVRPTSWHPHHIAERYTLFTLIVLGEAVLASTLAIKSGMTAGAPALSLALVGVSGFAVVCSMWWLYTARPAHRFLHDNRYAFSWGYGHYVVFSSIAAFGAGLAAIVDHKVGRVTDVSTLVLGGAVAVPVACFLLSVWFVHIRPHRPGPACSASYLVAAPLVLLAPFTPVPLELIALIMISAVVATELTRDDA
ncbi:low temperature requirement protein A [Streptosporangium sp. NPDC000396]|uniref:low temperature requirement protein A n=1 Tax=Streptosporangium sp. NPDC000396 TaxID=3366185 RepID=UPI0036B9C50E